MATPTWSDKGSATIPPDGGVPGGNHIFVDGMDVPWTSSQRSISTGAAYNAA